MDDQPQVCEKRAARQSVTERVRKYRLKHKTEDQLKNKLRMREVRKVEKSNRNKSETLMAEYRKKERERKKFYRQRKQTPKAVELQSTPTSDERPSPSKPGSFKSPQSFGKAVKRTLITLPKSPGKKRAIIVKLATIESLKVAMERKRKKSQKLRQPYHHSLVDLMWFIRVLV